MLCCCGEEARLRVYKSELVAALFSTLSTFNLLEKRRRRVTELVIQALG